MKTKLILTAFLSFALGVAAAVGVYFLTVGEVAWQEYVETKLIPTVVLALSAISALYFAALPIVNKIQASVAKFNQATSDVNAAAENGKRTDAALSAQDKKIAAFSERFDALEKRFADEISSVKTTAENTEKILRIGFGNTTELVRKGFAAEIAKVGKENEQNKET